jgi:general secretion pathway protein B
MSFILDALRRSERARRALGETPTDVPLEARRAPARRPWLALGLGLLAVNLGVLALVVWRMERAAPTATAAAPATPSLSTASRSREVRPLAAEAPASSVDAALPEPLPDTDPARSVLPPALADLPALAARLPALEIQVHTWAEQPAQRFVLVNLKRYTEGARLAEGPLLVAIVPEGLVLEHEGTRFLLPRR